MPGDYYWPNLGRIQHTFSGGRDISVITHWFLCDAVGGATVADLETVAAAIGGEFDSEIWTNFSHTWQHLQTEVADFTSADGATGFWASGASGGQDYEGVPAASAVLVNQELNLRYRGGHPRIYIPGAPVNLQQTPTEWTVAGIAAIQTGLNAYVTFVTGESIESQPLQMCCYHRPGAKHIAQGTTLTGQWEASITPATIRRRMRRAGHKK